MSVVLVVDDDPIVRSMAGEMLRTQGFTVHEAEEGAAALECVGREPVDLVLLDMLMPGKDGLETIMELRLRHPEVKILAISSGGRSEPGTYLRAAVAFGAHGAMPKPLRADTLATTVHALLGRQRNVVLH